MRRKRRACDGKDEQANSTTTAKADTTTAKADTTTEDPAVTECTHDYQVSETVDATCTAKGSKTYTCSKCGDSYSEEIEMLAHTFTDATCTVPKTCKTCGATEGDVAAHKYSGGTCTTAATCSVCGATEGEAKGHTFSGDSCSVCGAPKPSEGLEFRLSYSGDCYSVVGIGSCQTPDIVIPDMYEGLPVEQIGYSAFNSTPITSVYIPDSVTVIGDAAFWGCTSLTSVTIPDSVTVVGMSAFGGCTGLTSVIIGNSVEWINSDAFLGCTGLTAIYCEADSMHSGWNENWNRSATVYWGGEWEYVDGVPTVK